MAARDISAEIDRLTARRQELWSAGDGDGSDELGSIAARLTVLFEEKRTAAAGAGTPRQRAKAVKLAVAERELERLMSS